MQQIQHTQNTIHRGAYLVTHGCQELALGLIGLFCQLLGQHQLLLTGQSQTLFPQGINNLAIGTVNRRKGFKDGLTEPPRRISHTDHPHHLITKADRQADKVRNIRVAIHRPHGKVTLVHQYKFTPGNP